MYVATSSSVEEKVLEPYLIVKYIKPTTFIQSTALHSSIDILNYIFYIKNKISHLNRHIQSIEFGRK